MTTFSIVATPIGNMQDITLRALEVLHRAEVIIAEDTRVTGKLLKHHGIESALISYHARSGEQGIQKILEVLRTHRYIALVTDAGTPGISDPGSVVVDRVRVEMPEVVIEGIPGASAVTTALSIAGVPSSEFLFLGFLPHKKGRETLFKEIASSKRTVVLYESPHRILKTLASLEEHLDTERKVVVMRELTKLYEDVIRGSVAAVRKHFEEHTDQVRGEFVLIISS